MAALGNIGVDKTRSSSSISRPTLFAWTKQVAVTATVTGGTIGEIVYLSKDGGIICRAGINSSGDAVFYGLEDGEFHVRECLLDSHAWKVEVSGGTVTITPLTAGGGGGAGVTVSYAFIGT